MSNATNPEGTELDHDQFIRFQVLAPLVSDMLIKHQEEAGSRIKSDTSGRYTEAINMLLHWHTTLTEQAVLEARLDEVRIGSDMHQLMRRADRIAWSNSRYQQLKSQLRREGGE